ncbi:hypothetical protein B0H16DRAFT_1765311, partial [Mycena metata]
TLVTAIELDDDTRCGLFPPPGSSKHNNGLPKKHFHWQLVKKCFAKHPAYQDAFAKAVTPKQQDVWGGKIKNRLGTCDKVRAAMDLMGQTGAGLESVGNIQDGTELMTKWDEIKLNSPWFWEMCSLIGERPNLRPVGIGNNNSAIDVSLLLPGSDDDADGARTSSPDLFPETLGGKSVDSDDESSSSKKPIVVDNEDSDVAKAKGKSAGKRCAVSEPASPNVRPPTKKTKPQPAISVPTPTQAKLAKPATTKDKFTAAILAEEETRRKELALTKDKNRVRAEIELAKVKSLRDVKVEKTKMKTKEKLAKIELARLKMEQDHQFRMAQFGQTQYSQSHGQSSHAGSSRGGHSMFPHDNESERAFPAQSPHPQFLRRRQLFCVYFWIQYHGQRLLKPLPCSQGLSYRSLGALLPSPHALLLHLCSLAPIYPFSGLVRQMTSPFSAFVNYPHLWIFVVLYFRAFRPCPDRYMDCI